jgi:hypothetical protein
MRQTRREYASVVKLPTWAVLICLLVSCTFDRSSSATPKTEVVLKTSDRITAFTASLDGDLFVATRDSFFDRPYQSDHWNAVAHSIPTPVIRLRASSGNVVFGLSRGCGNLMKWTRGKGWNAERTPIDNLEWKRIDTVECVSVGDIWVADSGITYAVGSHGVILRNAGAGWTLETAAREVPVDVTVPEVATEQFYSVTGSTHGIYANTSRQLFRRAHGAWNEIPLDTGSGPTCFFYASATLAGKIYLGGSSHGCVAIFSESGPWHWMQLGALGQPFFSGASSHPSGAVLWTGGGEVLYVTEQAVKLVRFREFRSLRSAAVASGFLYLAGAVEGNGDVVARTRLGIGGMQ